MLVKNETYFICRTCLKTGTNYLNLFNYFIDGTVLSDMLIECITREAEEDDGLPSHICNECKTKLYSSWVFKSSALEAESKLRSTTKMTRRNEEPDVIKGETVVTSSDYNIDDAIQGQRADPFTYRDYTVNDELSTHNTDDDICNENETSKIYDEQGVIEYLGEYPCKNEILGVNDNENDLVECTTNLNSLEEKSFNFEVSIDNKMLIHSKDQQNSSINNNEAAAKLKRLRNSKKEFNQNSQDNIDSKEYNNSCAAEDQQTEKSENHTKIFSCSSCNRSFRSKKSLRMHMRLTHKYKYVCQICEIEFNTFRQLNHHEEIHTNECQECDICKKVFRSKRKLKEHTKVHERTSESKPICELCGKAYSNMFGLRQHYETHNPERTIPCPTCGKLFTNQKNMRAHARSHAAHASYICEYCNKGFKYLEIKKKHVLIHTGEKPYACKICDKRFNDTGTLCRHMLTHTGETKFVCDKCPYKCRYKQQFDNHLKKHK